MSEALKNLTSEFPSHVPRPAGAPLALQGVRVVDFSHFIAGPLATMLLADLGAEVIKIEPPGRGDDLRRYPPELPQLPDQGGPFLWSNRNKRSVALDLKHPEGLALARQLIAKADVVVENFSTGVMERLGLGAEACRAAHPGLIYCSVSAYGREGPFADRMGFDPVVQAESGFVSMNGYPDRQGVRASAAVMDMGTAMMVSNAVLAALFARTHTGAGQVVEVCLYETGLFMTGWAPMQHLLTGIEPQRHGNTSVDTCPSGVFSARDADFYINCGNDRVWQRLAANVLDRDDLASDAELAGRHGRQARREELFVVLGDIFKQHPFEFWQARMREAGVPCGIVRTVGQALRSDETQARGTVSWIAHPTAGPIPNIAPPWRFASTPVADPVAAPLVGQHTQQVLREVLGVDDGRYAALHAAGAFGPAATAAAPKGESP
jgi:crotonobetainyl-CoA:carnitine CoA-transferase CaiB-like acyl-CoA transferase